ncbi:helix-turn-helix domain-containing protein [Saccharothrix variisporea]|uniref:Helix-turn-helix protein n=1 Tax=Saccharothrix variisporea TaxID=543527 RepID=A0A495X7N2_9PSEU|nr:helix-turn-helix protein [Saccharothrix variisporea]
MPRPERPLGSGGDGLLRFAGELRALRRAAGSPGYRELARRANYSVTALSEAAGGRKLPTLPVVLAYVRACGGDVVEWQARWEAVAAEVTAGDGEEEGTPPYLGLASFQPGDADRFFGRERLVEDLVGLLAHRRFLAVFGASGSGKSSVLRAGVVPALTGPPPLLFTPGERPVEECARHLAVLLRQPVDDVLAGLSADPGYLHRAVCRRLADEPAAVDVTPEPPRRHRARRAGRRAPAGRRRGRHGQRPRGRPPAGCRARAERPRPPARHGLMPSWMSSGAAGSTAVLQLGVRGRRPGRSLSGRRSDGTRTAAAVRGHA